MNRCVRQNFEGVVDDLDRKALGAVAVIRRHYKAHGEARPDIMMEICARAPICAKCLARRTILLAIFLARRAISHSAGSCGSSKLERKPFEAASPCAPERFGLTSA
jgi:hypothetical protein